MASAALPLGPTVFPPQLVAKNSLGFTWNYTLFDGEGGKGLYFVRFPKVLFGGGAVPCHVLHNGTREKDPELATAMYANEERRVVFVTTAMPGRRGSGPGSTTWRFTPDIGDGTSAKNSLHQVTGTPGMGKTAEVFDWRYVKGSDAIKEVGAHGFELVRRTGGRSDIVAVLGFKSFSVKKRYTFAFLGDGLGLGREFEVMAVMTMIRVEFLFQEAARS